MADVKLLLLHSNTWNHLTLFKKKWTQAHLKMLPKDAFTNHTYLIYIYVEFWLVNACNIK